MIAGELQLTEVKHFYQTLNVPFHASPNEIKQSYRRLLKRWHPDLYPSGTPAHAEATQMAEMMNGAYAAISDAPLRYYSEPRHYSERTTRKESFTGSRVGTAMRGEQAGLDRQAIRMIARIEFWMRFVCGVLFGILLCFDMSFTLLAHVKSDAPFLTPACLGITLACGFASARYGDKFWYLILRRPGRRGW
jgi:hypothetical protein